MVLEIISVYFRRNKRLIFHNFSLKLKKSQTLILIGNNGAGKTSLFELIVGLLEPTSGQIKIYNVETSNLDMPRRRFFTFIPHKDSLKDNLTILENLEAWLTISELNASKNSVQKSLKFYQLSDFKNSLVSNLSQGQRKKVSLSKLLLSQNKLWLLDEPFNGLDIQSVKKTKSLIEKHTLNGGSVILSNHISLSLKNSKKIFLSSKKLFEKNFAVKFDDWGDI